MVLLPCRNREFQRQYGECPVKPCKFDGQVQKVQAVVFDVYGTLAEIREKRGPFRQLLRLGERSGRPTSPEDARTIMGSSLGLAAAADRFGIELSPAELAHLEREMRVEISSIRLFADTIPTIAMLQQAGLKVALCSNLARDYAQPILSLLPMRLDSYTWSFKVGAIKPDHGIYDNVCKSLGQNPANVLMVGDTPAADFFGPRAFGIQSVLLDRLGQRRPDTIVSLLDVPNLLDMT
jgi:HAD superfamily hydrolase (TIGR01549 family)